MSDFPFFANLDKHDREPGFLIGPFTVSGVYSQSSQAPYDSSIPDDLELNCFLCVPDADNPSKKILKQLSPGPVFKLGTINRMNPVSGEEDCLRMPATQEAIEIFPAQILKGLVKSGLEILDITGLQGKQR